MGQFILGPRQRVNDEPSLVHPLMPHIRGEEAEEDNLLPHPAQVAVSQRGCEHNDVGTHTHHGLHPQGIVVPEVTAHVHLQRRRQLVIINAAHRSRPSQVMTTMLGGDPLQGANEQ